MPDTVISRQGDTLDELIWRTRRLGPADLPNVLSLNPGLADHGAVLPLGTAVAVPAASTTPAVATRDLVQLWD
jgi:phage tail protein X